MAATYTCPNGSGERTNGTNSSSDKAFASLRNDGGIPDKADGLLKTHAEDPAAWYFGTVAQYLLQPPPSDGINLTRRRRRRRLTGKDRGEVVAAVHAFWSGEASRRAKAVPVSDYLRVVEVFYLFCEALRKRRQRRRVYLYSEEAGRAEEAKRLRPDYEITLVDAYADPVGTLDMFTSVANFFVGTAGSPLSRLVYALRAAESSSTVPLALTSALVDARWCAGAMGTGETMAAEEVQGLCGKVPRIRSINGSNSSNDGGLQA